MAGRQQTLMKPVLVINIVSGSSRQSLASMLGRCMFAGKLASSVPGGWQQHAAVVAKYVQSCTSCHHH
jgi:hypothetical protein